MHFLFLLRCTRVSLRCIRVPTVRVFDWVSCLVGFFRVVSGLAVALFGLFGLGFLWVLGCFLGFWLGFLGILSCVLGGALRFFDIYNITYQKKKLSVEVVPQYF